MNLQWVEEIKPELELQEFLDGLIELGRIEQGIRSYDWWKDEPHESKENLHSNQQVRASSHGDVW